MANLIEKRKTRKVKNILDSEQYFILYNMGKSVHRSTPETNIKLKDHNCYKFQLKFF